jgi:hypothetical protein
MSREYCAAHTDTDVVSSTLRLSLMQDHLSSPQLTLCHVVGSLSKPWFHIASVSTADRTSATNCCSLPLSYTTCQFCHSERWLQHICRYHRERNPFHTETGNTKLMSCLRVNIPGSHAMQPCWPCIAGLHHTNARSR